MSNLEPAQLLCHEQQLFRLDCQLSMGYTLQHYAARSSCAFTVQRTECTEILKWIYDLIYFIGLFAIYLKKVSCHDENSNAEFEII